ncbi:MAG: ABC transporter permease subunit [Planctomycetota bacterium]
MTAALSIARNTFIESLRQPTIFVVVLVCGLLQYLTTAATGYSMGYRIYADGEVTGDDKMLLDVGMATVFVGGIILASFIATAALTREIDNKTVLTVVSKPIGRPSVVFGKFIGVTGAMAIASVILITQLLFAIRHGVMTTAADIIDWPAILFGAGSFALAGVFAAFVNFMYNWSFNQTFTLTLLPLHVGAYVLTLVFSDEWAMQPITTDLKPQILMACAALGGALMVVTGVAVAASTRLGQVMTIVACAGVFVTGLLSNHLLGKRAFQNDAFATIDEIVYERDDDVGLLDPGDEAVLTTEAPHEITLEIGMPIYFGPSPNGLGIAVPRFDPPGPDVDLENDLFPPEVPPALVITEVVGKDIRVKHVGGSPLDLRRAPEVGDFLFIQPTTLNPVFASVWAVVPNMHAFWLVDAVTQAAPIPLSHLGLIVVYALAQVGACLAIAVILFEGRDVG